MNEKYLPLGSVVMLKGGKKRLMVTGFCITPNNDENTVFDYSGVIFPEGMITNEQTALFNHDQIERVDYLGLIDDEEKNFKLKLNELINSNGNVVDNIESSIEIPIMQNSNSSIENNSDIETL